MTNSAETLRTTALAWHGIFLAPGFVLTGDIKKGGLIRLLQDFQSVEFTISAIYPHGHNLSAKVRSFIDVLAERFADHRNWLGPPAAASDNAGRG